MMYVSSANAYLGGLYYKYLMWTYMFGQEINQKGVDMLSAMFRANMVKA